MPEEQAFVCLVHLLHTYQFRGLYTPRMELLQLRLYQFDRLLQETLPRIYQHLDEQGIRSTMYASQWFMTLFSYRFPLDLVFRVMDLIFATGVVYGAAGEGGMMDAMMERVSEGVAAVSGAPNSLRSADAGSEGAIVVFRLALALLKKNEETLLALDFEPLLEFLKHGLIDIYTGLAVKASTPSQKSDLSQRVEPPQRKDHPSRKTDSIKRHLHVNKKALDDLVRDAVSSQLRNINKKKLGTLRRDYEEELRKSDPAYLAERSLESQNQRLQLDLKRSEKQLSDLNRDHCDLAGQLVSLRLEYSKEKDASEALRRQVADLKRVLAGEISQINPDYLERMMHYDAETSAAPLGLPAEEQVTILLRQNAALMEELEMWRNMAQQQQQQQQQVGGDGGGGVFGVDTDSGRWSSSRKWRRNKRTAVIPVRVGICLWISRSVCFSSRKVEGSEEDKETSSCNTDGVLCVCVCVCVCFNLLVPKSSTIPRPLLTGKVRSPSIAGGNMTHFSHVNFPLEIDC